eukprot:gene30743-19120_t
MRERVLAPLGLLSLGTSSASYERGTDGGFTCDRSRKDSACMAAMQAARYESGMRRWATRCCFGNYPILIPGFDGDHDNGEFVDMADMKDGLVGGYLQMPLYDVGMTSLAVSEASALAELAAVLGRAADAATLRGRAARLRALMPHLCDAAPHARCGFCVAPGGDFAGNDESCWWGLPSIAASDRAFPQSGYWRGYVWGPLSILTYWGLQ